MSEVSKSPETNELANTAATAPADSEQSQPNGFKLLIEFAPLILFLVVYLFFGIFIATGVLIFSTLVSVLLSYLKFRRVEPMPLVSAAIITLLGGLTIYLNDETFVKMKPTIVYIGFGLALSGATLIGYRPIKTILSASLKLADTAWTQLQILWSGFFFAMALLNEYVWRSFSTDTWVYFKVFGFLPITMVFATITIGYFIQNTERLDTK